MLVNIQIKTVQVRKNNSGFKETEYTLYAISNHTGSLDFGHYYAQAIINLDTVKLIIYGMSLTILMQVRSALLIWTVAQFMHYFIKEIIKYLIYSYL